jgi:hypothetical protein
MKFRIQRLEHPVAPSWQQPIRGLASRFARAGSELLSALAVITVVAFGIAGPAAAQPAKGFSFIAYGDSRSMMYLPYTKADIAKIHAALVECFSIILAERIAEAIVQKDVKLSFDSKTGALTGVEMPFITRSEVARLTFHEGWVTEATVEDIKLAPGVRTVMYRNYGGDWVGHSVAREMKTGVPKFVVNTGDVVWWGAQGRTVRDSPYWKRMNTLLFSHLPPPDAALKAAGLEGRYFPSVGNHEVWDDPQIEGVLSAAPYLKKLGVSAEKLTYKFDFGGARFIFLWTGKADRFSPSGWDSTRPVYKEQLKELIAWLDEAKSKRIRNVFVVFHNPVYNRSGFAPIPEDTNPHSTLASYAKDFAEIIVLNGHVHTTEHFDVDGVKYFVLGGGGAEQDPILPGRTAIPRPAGYPPELYWNGKPPIEEYNYLSFSVKPGEKTNVSLKRFRPTSSTPFEEVTLSKGGPAK